jgi:DNA-binding response OmpR family regulator
MVITEPSTVSARILVVDDDADTARMMSRLLNSSGYATMTAGTVAEARKLCDGHRFDLLIADLSLPDGSGADLLRHDEACFGKGIIVSGHDEQRHEALGIAAGYSDYLLKPIQFDVLLNVVRRVLERN